jgi:arylsulfatase A-like enzyme
MSRLLSILLIGIATAAGQDGFSRDPLNRNPLPDAPNILLIFVDDLGWKDVGYQGSDFHETPHIDKLAKDGMVFSSGYAAAGNCAPSRACLMSGQYTPRHGLYAVGSTRRGAVNQMRMVPVANSKGLRSDIVTLAEVLRDSGYTTGCFGKWHLGSADNGTDPKSQGFDVVMDRKQSGSGVRGDPKAVFSITASAAGFMQANNESPWFAFVSHHAIHTGLQARRTTLERFEKKTPGGQHKNPLYAACTYELDAGIGMLLAKIDELGERDDTLVVFTSDNGATTESPQEPLRGNKGSYHEGGIRVPFVVRWPKRIAAGTTCSVPVSNVDLFPTFLAAAGVEVPDGKILDGESLLPLFADGGTLEREAIFWHFPGYLDRPVLRGRDPLFRTRPVSVIRKGDWKLCLYHEEWQLDGGRTRLAANNATDLYDLRTDIGERKDLSETNAAKRNELLDDLLGWFDATGAELPNRRNPSYDPDAAPDPGGTTRKKAKP